MGFLKPYLFHLLSLVKRIGILFLAYFFCRLIFYYVNKDQFKGIEFDQALDILKGGLVFDTSAIFFTNLLFIVLWLLPIQLLIKSKLYYKTVLYTFIFFNVVCLLLNVVDFYFFEYNLKRMTADFSYITQEGNTNLVVKQYIVDHFIPVILYISLAGLYSYSNFKIKDTDQWIKPTVTFYSLHLLVLFVIIALSIGGMRGGFLHSTRPITLSNAGQYVKNPAWIPLVLNTPFSIIKTYNHKPFDNIKYMPDSEASKWYNPVVHLHHAPDSFKPKNIVIIILESYSREHSAFLNPDLYTNKAGYTPFLDSLMQHSFTCTNAFANGRKSIDAMPSILASIPSTQVPYVLSHNSLNKLNSLASLLKPNGYTSAFFHGAPNGSMGFQAFAQIAGFDKYYGKSEFNNDSHYDGIWGIWDEEFFQYYAQTLDTLESPFLGVCFSISSHHPFKVPTKYNGVFPKGPLEVHECVGYTDHALRNFFKTASSMDWYENTLFVITADHSTVSFSEKYKTSIGAHAIPILYYSPGDSTLNKIFPAVTQQSDILPSVLDYLNFNGKFVAFGSSVFNAEHPRFAYHYVDEHYQYIDSRNFISSFNGSDLSGLYDLNKSWLRNENLIHEVEYDSLKTNHLKMHQAIKQQYNQRINNNLLTKTD